MKQNLVLILFCVIWLSFFAAVAPAQEAKNSQQKDAWIQTIVNYLELTPQQQTELKQVVKNARDDRLRLIKTSAIILKELKALVDQNAPDNELLGKIALLNEVKERFLAIEKQQTEASKKILTPLQQAKFILLTAKTKIDRAKKSKKKVEASPTAEHKQ